MRKSRAVPKSSSSAIVKVRAEPLPAPSDAPGHNPAAVYLASLGSAKSRRTMAYALERVANLLTGGKQRAASVDWTAIRFHHAAAIRAKLSEELAPSSVNLVLCALRGVLRAAKSLGQLDADDLAEVLEVRSVRSHRLPKGRSLVANEIESLLAACEKQASVAGARDAAILATLYSTGLRRSELAALSLQDWDRRTGAIHVRAGKGRKERLVYLAAGADEALEAWIRVRGSWAGALFTPVNKADRVTRRQMTDQALVYILRRRADAAGTERFSPHDLRRTFISELLDSGADLSAAQQLAGHASPTTTSRYDRRGERAKRDAVRRLRVPYAGRRPSELS